MDAGVGRISSLDVTVDVERIADEEVDVVSGENGVAVGTGNCVTAGLQPENRKANTTIKTEPLDFIWNLICT
jgi:hypothetical protein